ncbi:MAG: hypothetical protein P8Y78_09985 [Acidihalobacter sp.]
MLSTQTLRQWIEVYSCLVGIHAGTEADVLEGALEVAVSPDLGACGLPQAFAEGCGLGQALEVRRRAAADAARLGWRRRRRPAPRARGRAGAVDRLQLDRGAGRIDIDDPAQLAKLGQFVFGVEEKTLQQKRSAFPRAIQLGHEHAYPQLVGLDLDVQLFVEDRHRWGA